MIFLCPYCLTHFERTGRALTSLLYRLKTKGGAEPCCSLKCSARHRDQSFKDQIKVSAPYFYQDRWRVCLTHLDGSQRTMHLSQFKMEKKIGRPLKDGEHVHHIDGDRTNDAQENLKVISASEHSKLHNPQHSRDFTCPQCSRKFTLSGRRLTDQQRLRYSHRDGPFCSKSCATKFQWSR